MKTALEKINSCPLFAKEALEMVYRDKVFVAHNPHGNHTDGFFKTKRGAEGRVKKQTSFAYYNEGINEMVCAGNGLIVEEVNAFDIVDPYHSIELWYKWIRKEILGQVHMYNYVINQAKYMQVGDEVMEYLVKTIEELKNGDGLTVLENENNEVVESEVVEEIVSEEEVEGIVSANDGITYTLNEQHNGVEVTFAHKPDQSVNDELKRNGFRWHRGGYWYAKQSPERIELAKRLSGSCESADSVRPIPSPIAYEDINIDDIETYVVSKELQDREHDQAFVFRRNKIDRTKEIQNHFTGYNQRVSSVLEKNTSPHIEYSLKKALQRYKKKYYENHLNYLRHRSVNPSWAVTGRGNLNMQRYNKALSREDKLIQESVELTKWIDVQISKAIRDIRRMEKQLRELGA